MKRKIICGIYKITNLMNNKCIIGQSVNITRRWAKYRSELKQNELPRH